MKIIQSVFVIALMAVITGCSNDREDPIISQSQTSKPPFGGTVWISPTIITDDDPNIFKSISATGKGIRTMFDRRVNDWIQVEAYLFDVIYDDNIIVEIQVNPEFSEIQARSYAEEYAVYLGRLPRGCFRNLKTVWVHDGNENFMGWNNSILIHVGLANQIKDDGFMEEVLLHEGSHSSLDRHHKYSGKWFQAQENDRTFISTYARDNPDREDIAETFPLYFALRYKPESLTEDQRNKILSTIPNRIEYFDNQNFDFFPWSE